MTQLIPENVSIWLVDWSVVTIMGNTMIMESEAEWVGRRGGIRDGSPQAEGNERRPPPPHFQNRGKGPTCCLTFARRARAQLQLDP